jgi:hypothetical protein
MQIVGQIIKGTVTVIDVYGKEQTLGKGQTIVLGDTVKAKSEDALILFDNNPEPVIIRGDTAIEIDDDFLAYLATQAKKAEEGVETTLAEEIQNEDLQAFIDSEDESFLNDNTLVVESSSINSIELFDAEIQDINLNREVVAEENAPESNIQFSLVGEDGQYYVRGSDTEKLSVFAHAREGTLSDADNDRHFEVLEVNRGSVPVATINTVLQNTDLPLATTVDVSSVVQEVVDTLEIWESGAYLDAHDMRVLGISHDGIDVANINAALAHTNFYNEGTIESFYPTTEGIIGTLQTLQEGDTVSNEQLQNLGVLTSGQTLSQGELSHLSTLMGDLTPSSDAYITELSAQSTVLYTNAIPPTLLDLVESSDSGLSDDNRTNDTTPTLNIGLPADVTAGDTLIISDGSEVSVTHIITAEEAKAHTVAITLGTLDEGEHTLSATITDAHGNVSDAKALNLPSVLTIDTTAGISIDANIAEDNTINAQEHDKPLLISGTSTGVEAGQTVTVTLNGHTYTTDIQTDGTWSFTVPKEDVQTLKDGSNYDITANVSDLSDNAASDTHPISINTSAGISIDIVAGDNIINDSEYTDTDGILLQGGTTGIENGQEVTIRIKDADGTVLFTDSTVVTDVNDKEEGSWTYTVSSDNIEDVLSHGVSYTVEVTASDTSGNEAEPATQDVVVDIKADSDDNLGITLSDASDVYEENKTLSHDNQTNDTSPQMDLSGIDADIQTVSVTFTDSADPAHTLTVAATQNDDKTWTLPTQELTGFEDGAVTATVTVVDHVDNEDTASTTFTLDTRADNDFDPEVNDGEALGIALSEASDNNDVNNVYNAHVQDGDNQTNDTSPQMDLSGIDADIQTVSVKFTDSADPAHTLTVAATQNDDKTWTLPTQELTGFQDGVVTAIVTVSDDANNTTKANTKFTLDTSADTGAPLSLTLSVDADKHDFENNEPNGTDPQAGIDNQTNDKTPTLTLTGVDTDIQKGNITLYENGIKVDAQIGENADGSYSLTPTAELGDGKHAFEVRVVDDAGNATTVHNTQTITIDTEVTAVSAQRGENDTFQFTRLREVIDAEKSESGLYQLEVKTDEKHGSKVIFTATYDDSTDRWTLDVKKEFSISINEVTSLFSDDLTSLSSDNLINGISITKAGTPIGIKGNIEVTTIDAVGNSSEFGTETLNTDEDIELTGTIKLSKGDTIKSITINDHTYHY